MSERASRLVVIGASAGGVEALKEVVAGLPGDLDAAVGVVLHVAPGGPGRLPSILARAGQLPAEHPVHGEPVLRGRIYVAPPDRHVLVRDHRWAVVRGPRENGARPAIDPLFRSAASSFGRSVVAVVLSGTLSDGSAGAAAVSRVGGSVIVQDPSDAVFPGMPAAAIARDHPDRVLPLGEIASAVVQSLSSLSQEEPVSENDRQEMSLETSFAALDRNAVSASTPPGSPSSFSCPACGGVLWEVDDGELLRFRCRVGHAYTADAVVDAEDESVEAALFAALRALHERSDLATRVAGRLRERGGRGASRFDRIAEEALEQAELIRRTLLERDGEDDTG
jgi:two-component system chemotaxis response regulator CheB